MWFQMPVGCGGITVERQQFEPEFTDEDGRRYFRAPDHFANRILDIKGFVSVSQPPGAPEDLAKEDPKRDQTIAELASMRSAQDATIQDLRTDLQVAVSTIAALKNENGDLKRQVEELTAKVGDLEEELEDRPAAPLPVVKAK